MEQVALMGENQNVCRLLLKPVAKNHTEDLDIEVTTVLILSEIIGRVGIEWIYLVHDWDCWLL
jgi:hypothetical protein